MPNITGIILLYEGICTISYTARQHDGELLLILTVTDSERVCCQLCKHSTQLWIKAEKQDKLQEKKSKK